MGMSNEPSDGIFFLTLTLFSSFSRNGSHFFKILVTHVLQTLEFSKWEYD